MARTKGDEVKRMYQGAEAGKDNTGEISRKLRALYDSVQNEDVPDRFLDLLEKLDEAEKSSGKSSGNE